MYSLCVGVGGGGGGCYNDKKENESFLMYKEIQFRWDKFAKSHMTKGFLIYEEMHNTFPYMRRPSIVYDFATAPSEFPYLKGKFDFTFYQCIVYPPPLTSRFRNN